MRPAPQADLYSLDEIALAAGVPEAAVRQALGPARDLVGFEEAVRVGRLLAAACSETAPPDSAVRIPDSAFRIPDSAFPAPHTAFPEARIPQSRSLPLLVSSALHAALIAVLLLATFNLAPRAAALRIDDRPADLMRLVFLATPGPGGGGGGGGLLQKTPPPKAMREGTHRISSPLPQRVEPPPIVSTPKPPEPKPEPPLKSEQLPVVVAPIITAPADPKDRVGVLAQTTVETESHGPGVGGGSGTGKGTGLGEGDGSGVGAGSGGGTGGGPYRPGSGIEAPRLLHEVKADYTEDARQRGLAGEVLLEIVVRRDGSVGDVRILQGLGGGLNERAVQAVRQWRFTPARRLGTPVDVIVEVAVEFRLR